MKKTDKIQHLLQYGTNMAIIYKEKKKTMIIALDKPNLIKCENYLGPLKWQESINF